MGWPQQPDRVRISPTVSGSARPVGRRDNDLMDVRIAAYGVIIQDERILLAHWSENRQSGWTLPGGGLEEYETCEQAAIREIREETGHAAELTKLLGIDSRFVAAADRIWQNDGPLHALRLVFEAAVIGGDLTHEVDGSTDEAKWFPLIDLDALVLTSLVPAALAMLTR